MQKQNFNQHFNPKYWITLLLATFIFTTPLWAQSRTQVFESTYFANHMNQWKQKMTQTRRGSKAWSVSYSKRGGMIENRVNHSYSPVTWSLYKTVLLADKDEILMDLNFSFHNDQYKAVNVNVTHQNRKYNLYNQMQSKKGFQRKVIDLSQFRGKKVIISVELYKSYRVKAIKPGLSIKSVRIYSPSKPAPDLNVHVASLYLNQLSKQDLQNTPVSETLTKMIRSFDIVLLQNITDQEAHLLTDVLNMLNQNQADSYGLAIIPVGMLNKDQSISAYLYRTQKFQLLRNQLVGELVGYLKHAVHQVTVKHVTSGQVLNLLGTHLSKSDVAAEMLMVNHYANTRLNRLHDNEELMIVGNLNADCDYFNLEQHMTHPMFNNENLYLHISNHVDTVLGAEQCSYDRILSSMLPANKVSTKNSNYVIQSAALNYTDVWNIPSPIAHVISKHLPVWTKIRLNP